MRKIEDGNCERRNGKDQLKTKTKQNGKSRRKASDIKKEGVCRRKEERERVGRKKCVKEGGRVRNGAGSWCRCAESCSFFPNA